MLRSPIVSPVAEDETCTTLRWLDAPTGKDAGDFDDVLLAVTAVHAKGVELEQLTRVILVNPFGHAVRLKAAHPRWF